MFRRYYEELTNDQKRQLAKYIGKTRRQIREKYVAKHPLDRTLPSIDTMVLILLASKEITPKKALDESDIVNHFVLEPVREMKYQFLASVDKL